jgi:hypothetical protein
MRPLHIVLPSGFEFRVTPTHIFFLCAVLAAGALLAVYVQLLNDSMAQTRQWSAPVVKTDSHKPPELRLPMHERFTGQPAVRLRTGTPGQVSTRESA